MIKSLILKDFRNYSHAVFSFAPNLNTLWGENAQGKTNLLEALYVLMTGRSFRTTHLSDLIRFGTDAFYLEALFDKNGIEQTLKFYFDGETRHIVYNSTPLSTLSHLLGILHGVILSPDDRNLIKGGPQFRRHFLDLLIAPSNPLYLHHLSRYHAALKQRNTLLRRKSLKNIEIWEEQIAPSAAFLTHRRLETTQELERLSLENNAISEPLTLAYRPVGSPPYQSHETLTTFFLEQLAKQRQRDLELGSTQTGPHRDDLLIYLGEKEARKFASEGQQRSCITSLRLAHWKWLHTVLDEKPILCLDDVGVSFDRIREENLLNTIQNLGTQVFVTSARPLPDPGHAIRIERGQPAFVHC